MFTERCVEIFTEGDCWLLARTLHEMTGWRLIFAHEVCTGEPWYELWRHVGVMHPSGLVLDVHGLTKRALWRKSWAHGTKVTTSVKILDGEKVVFDSSPRMVKRVAKKLLEAYPA